MDAYGKKIYLIKNEDYEDKKVIAEDMYDALYKYKEYLRDHISYDYSVIECFGQITSCEYLGDFNEEDYIQ